jgi:EAL domain-containing protein (putative c-di-GMP-specific phosphodiesterase class I)
VRYVLFEPSMSDQTMDRIDMESDLRRAIERGELRVHYQPLIDLTTDRIVGFEALVRWQHPVRGLVPPLSFIPLAEETGLIIPLGKWVLETACRQAMRWRDARPEGPQLMMSVNLSARQFVQPDLVDQVDAILTETGLDPSTLELEITESVVMDQSEVGIRSLQRLRDMGVRLVLDDFGTGYSSLAYLKHLPLDTIKIDRTFVAGLDGEADRSIVEAVIALAHGLRISVVAEGIETEAQFEILRTMGCDVGQGYLFARPLPEAEAARLLGPGRSSVSTRATAAVVSGATKPARGAARVRASRTLVPAERGAASGGARPS